MERKLKTCTECQSEFFIDVATMPDLCPECAHQLYGYKKCNHQFENGRCVKCYWNGNQSEFLKSKTKQPKK